MGLFDWLNANHTATKVDPDGSWEAEGPLNKGDSGWFSKHIYYGNDVDNPQDHHHSVEIYDPKGNYVQSKSLK